VVLSCQQKAILQHYAILHEGRGVEKQLHAFFILVQDEMSDQFPGNINYLTAVEADITSLARVLSLYLQGSYGEKRMM
jgi:hypothetical protein